LSLWAWLALVIAGLARPDKKPALRGAVKAAGAVFVALGVVCAITVKERFGEKPAVVVVPEAVARFGPLEESESHFTLRDGAEVVIRDAKDGWWQIVDAQGRAGWVKDKQVTALK
jgi:SH3-like domain-containing protein